MSIDPNSRYIVLCNGEAILPEFTDCILDYWTAETVLEFVRLIDPSKELIIQKVSFIDTEQTKKGGLNE